MLLINDAIEMDFDSVRVDPFWNLGDSNELKMHRIHTYPAKFPAFITTKALDYARKNSIRAKYIADVFCGCGTVAFEAKRNNIDFWGCDINPVATMIARVKSRKYQSLRLKKYYQNIMTSFSELNRLEANYEHANERLKYWFDREHYEALYRLMSAIEKSTPPRSDYRLFFLCSFSNILKSTSRWFMKAIKPQIDPNKKPANVLEIFKQQCEFMIIANNESDINGHSKTKIVTGNFLDSSIKKPKVDMIITSPPYVTSYEYADLHQLSSVWLGFAEDYRELRKGSIGSRYHIYDFEGNLEFLNTVGSQIVLNLMKQCKSKARDLAKYFLDMQQVADLTYSMLNDSGIGFFVVGNTEHKGIKIDNVRHLAESLQKSGFNEMYVTKRRISNKYFTPYRDVQGRFTRNSESRKIYSEEYILIGIK
jgi:methylase of polypeptide subunit release factors